MKKIIGGKSYNTETATKIGSASSRHCSYSDFNYWEESLYRTQKGAFFIAGEGGANTHYSRSCGQNSWCGGSGLRVIDATEAREWVEQHCNSQYEAVFGVVEAA